MLTVRFWLVCGLIAVGILFGICCYLALFGWNLVGWGCVWAMRSVVCGLGFGCVLTWWFVGGISVFVAVVVCGFSMVTLWLFVGVV